MRRSLYNTLGLTYPREISLEGFPDFIGYVSGKEFDRGGIYGREVSGELK